MRLTNILPLNLPDEKDLILGSINLAARLYLMMSFGEVPNAFTPERALSWTGASIQDFLKQHLEPRQVLASTSVKLQKIFNARNIQRLAGIKIEWTSDLGQHLRMIHDDERVAIFHNASFLRLHQQRYVTSNCNRFLFESPKILIPAAAEYFLRASSTRLSEHSLFSSHNQTKRSRSGSKDFHRKLISLSEYVAL
jgi:hypothetical protein